MRKENYLEAGRIHIEIEEVSIVYGDGILDINKHDIPEDI
jgi:hypothetical protein